MAIFSLVFFRVFSSLLSVLIGFLSGKFSNVEKDSITSLLFYFVAPIVFFAIRTSTNLTFNSLGITLVTFLLATTLGFFSYWLYGKIWQDSHRNILALSAGTGNSGYVVLPIATTLFDDYTLSIYALGLIGIAIYEASVGCYFCARSIGTFKQSVMKVIRLPILNAFFLGCILSLAGFQLPNVFDEFVNNMKGAFSILGMVTIGLALSKVKEFELDLKFTGAAFASKFLFYPILFNLFILLDRFVLGWYNANYYNALQMLSIAPMATNTIVLASLYKIHPEKVAAVVLLSLLFVLLYMPIMATIFLQDIRPI
ncbi:MAG: AEC family transporter [Rickettsiaceae bacterium]|nr:AEC family transporter [Rickettsiaceae bacterium]MDP4832804.1 AEC family transporter [Rickettsiaceae bacterium]MDP5021328.1 AEC family transporter [Rickettsiaceae bacterium]MDP5083330.1 AEC family transporter [Rickettsiaceae bacterium]